MDKTLLDKITEDGMVKCYSESEILNRKVVGRGGFGIVYKAQLKHTGVTVAIKMLLLDVYNDEQELYKKFVKEVCYYCCCCLSLPQLYVPDNKYLCVSAESSQEGG